MAAGKVLFVLVVAASSCAFLGSSSSAFAPGLVGASDLGSSDLGARRALGAARKLATSVSSTSGSSTSGSSASGSSASSGSSTTSSRCTDEAFACALDSTCVTCMEAASDGDDGSGGNDGGDDDGDDGGDDDTIDTECVSGYLEDGQSLTDLCAVFGASLCCTELMVDDDCVSNGAVVDMMVCAMEGEECTIDDVPCIEASSDTESDTDDDTESDTDGDDTESDTDDVSEDTSASGSVILVGEGQLSTAKVVVTGTVGFLLTISSLV